MDSFGGDGARDFFSQPDPYSPSQCVFGGQATPAHGFTASRLELDGLDLNSESNAFPPSWEYPGYRPGRGQSEVGGAFAGGASGGQRGSGSRPPRPRRSAGLRPGCGAGTGGTGGGGRAGAQASRAARRGSARRAGAPGPSRSGGAHESNGQMRDDSSGNDETDPEPPQMKTKLDKANWSERNSYVLLELIREQVKMGNYFNGQMTPRGYPIVAQRFFERTNLRHDNTQFRNRIRQLKQMYGFIKDITTRRTGLGTGPDGWPVADDEWWDEATQRNSEWKKLKHGPPPYMELLRQIFEGVAVDGSSAYVPGQAAADAEEQYYEDDDDVHEVPHQDSPATSGSQKRASSTNTTGTSSCKRSKSPIVHVFNQFLAQNEQHAQERAAFMERQSTFEQEMARQQMARSTHQLERKKSELQKVMQLAIDAGVSRNSVEFYAIGYLCKDEEMKELFLNLQTGPERVQFLRRFCMDYQLQ